MRRVRNASGLRAIPPDPDGSTSLPFQAIEGVDGWLIRWPALGEGFLIPFARGREVAFLLVVPPQVIARDAPVGIEGEGLLEMGPRIRLAQPVERDSDAERV